MKRLLCLLLILVSLPICFAGCNQSGAPGPVTGEVGDESEGTPPEEGEAPAKGWNDLPKTKYDAEFNILGRGGAGTWNTEDLFAEDTSTALSAAVFSRNSAVETRHGITINVNAYTGKYAAMLEAMELAGTNDFALYDIPLGQWGYAVVNGYFENLYKLDELDLEDSWWDQRFVEDVTLYGQLYGILSDATYIDKAATWAVEFNKDMFAAYELEDNPYKLVDEGKWTIEKMTELAQKVNLDVNEDGVMELGGQDIYGIAGEIANLDFLFQGCGFTYGGFENGEIILNLDRNKDQANNIFQKIFDLVADSSFTYMAEAHSEQWKGGRDFFEAQQALFYIGGVVILPAYFKAFEHDYGVIPMPKYDENQESYYNAITTFNCPTFCIPKNATDLSMSAVVMQAMACRGETSITPVYYNTILKEQASRDSDSWRMLDIIFENRVFDLCTVYNFGNLAGNGQNSYISVLVKNGQRDQLVSTIETYASTADARIEELMTFYDENYVPQS